jgi:hypothetical protein
VRDVLTPTASRRAKTRLCPVEPRTHFVIRSTCACAVGEQRVSLVAPLPLSALLH